MAEKERRNDELIFARLDYIKEGVDGIKETVSGLGEDNKKQWGALNEHAIKLAVLETRQIPSKTVPLSGFNYRNLKYIIPAALTFLGGIVAIILKYAK